MRRMPLFMGLLSIADHGELISGVLPSRRTSHSTPRSTLLLFSQNSHQQQRDNQRNTMTERRITNHFPISSPMLRLMSN